MTLFPSAVTRLPRLGELMVKVIVPPLARVMRAVDGPEDDQLAVWLVHAEAPSHFVYVADPSALSFSCRPWWNQVPVISGCAYTTGAATRAETNKHNVTAAGRARSGDMKACYVRAPAGKILRTTDKWMVRGSDGGEPACEKMVAGPAII